MVLINLLASYFFEVVVSESQQLKTVCQVTSLMLPGLGSPKP
jgi:hypothetical protein